MHAAKVPEVEQDRQRRVEEMVAEHGPHWSDAFKPGSFGCHELLDRTNMVANIIDEFVLSHPSCLQDPEWFALASRAADSLGELYQRIGAAHLTEGDESPQSP